MSKMLYSSSEPLSYNEKTAKGCSGFISAPFSKRLALAGTNNSNLFYPSVSTQRGLNHPIEALPFFKPVSQHT